ncbi:Putative amidase domain-containing protein [Planifilum fulgidum]|jgi:hypothetical protein|uniref:Putative amidase domain-containing protein n=1 Tax=Planifilum fulgidum TaxID=201973 RepID=A0A1I2S9G3_9BACL|nr:amidase domain-containing protein [Planifilum fulgidum]SFG49438.1 Putative amidase domain-containing protein [Planifilum fulgidum]
MVERPWHKPLVAWFESQNRFWLEGEEEKLLRLVTDSEAEWVKAETERMQRARKQVREREVRPVKGECRIRVARRERMEEEEVLLWIRSDRRLTVEQKDALIEEEEIAWFRVLIQFVGDGWRIAHCFPEAEPVEWVRPPRVSLSDSETPPAFASAGYDRRRAVQYANLWWNGYNPRYRRFDVDCTNYVSQCIHAGGVPMDFSPVRDRGWWYRRDLWSYSWAVAHSLQWYLAKGGGPMRAVQVSRPEELLPGDIICYDWDGDGRWDHNTIVTAKDPAGMPLVNAHTVNSRHRYWDYRDSYAWTPNTRYRFYRIEG